VHRADARRWSVGAGCSQSAFSAGLGAGGHERTSRYRRCGCAGCSWWPKLPPVSVSHLQWTLGIRGADERSWARLACAAPLDAFHATVEPARGPRARRLQQALAVCDPLTLLAGCELSYTERGGDDTAVPSFVFYSDINEYVVTTPSYITSVTFLATTNHAADVELKLQGNIAMEAGALRSLYTSSATSAL
jgi:hypothetical protein